MTINLDFVSLLHFNTYILSILNCEKVVSDSVGAGVKVTLGI